MVQVYPSICTIHMHIEHSILYIYILFIWTPHSVDMDTIVDRMLLRIQVSTVPKREAGVLSWASTLAGFTVWRSFLSHLYWVAPPHSIFHQKVYAIKFQATKFVQRSSLQRHLGLSQGDWPFSHNPFEALIVVVSTLPLAALAHFDDKSFECENIRLERPSSLFRAAGTGFVRPTFPTRTMSW